MKTTIVGKNGFCFKSFIKNQKGITIVLVAFLIVVFLGFAALAVDLGFAYVYRTRLQKAVDAGALAGARVLYQNEGASIAPSIAKDNALNIARKNVNDATYETDIGHWSFGMGSLQRDFYPYTGSDPPDPIEIANFTETQLDEMEEHINSVRMTAVGQSPSFFSKIWGKNSIQVTSSAVAYLGYSGTLDVFDVDFPLAICAESIKWDSETLNCGLGRLIHSGQSSGQSNFNTGAWTNYSSGCSINFNTGNQQGGLQYLLNSMQAPDCHVKNPNPIVLGQGVSTGGGQSDVGFSDMAECTGFVPKKNNPQRDSSWVITVLVVDCKGSNNPSGCLDVLGAVSMEIVHVTDTFPSSENKKYDDVPPRMSSSIGNFNRPDLTGKARWDAFVDFFDLEVLNQTSKVHESASEHYYQKSIYALPSCKKVEPRGISGGSNFGLMAKVPVLVK